MLLLIANDGPLPAEWRDHELFHVIGPIIGSAMSAAISLALIASVADIGYPRPRFARAPMEQMAFETACRIAALSEPQLRLAWRSLARCPKRDGEVEALPAACCPSRSLPPDDGRARPNRRSGSAGQP